MYQCLEMPIKHHQVTFKSLKTSYNETNEIVLDAEIKKFVKILLFK